MCALCEVSVCFGENFPSLFPQLDLGTFAKAQQASTSIVLQLLTLSGSYSRLQEWSSVFWWFKSRFFLIKFTSSKIPGHFHRHMQGIKWCWSFWRIGYERELQRCSQGQRATGATLATHCWLTCQRWTDRNGGQRSIDITTLHIFILAMFRKITRSMIFHVLASMFIYVLNLKISISSVFLKSCCT